MDDVKGREDSMKKLIFILLAVLILGGCTQKQELTTDTFYANILDINGNVLVVEGLEVNDINSRGQFYLTVDQNTQLIWLGTEITMDDLDEGDRISITWSGLVRESSPAQIANPVHRIKLLEDEK